MGNPKALCFQINVGLLMLCCACSGLYPPTFYDDSTRRLRDYENNYFIKVPPHFQPLADAKETPILASHTEEIGHPSLFNKGQQVVLGMFRWPEKVEPFAWFEIMDAVKNNDLDTQNPIFLPDLLRLFDWSSQGIKWRTYDNFLVLEPPADSATNHQLKIAMQPYATLKGGEKNSLFVAFVLSAPTADAKQVQKDFEFLLEHTELSYFLNYERSRDKKLTFH